MIGTVETHLRLLTPPSRGNLLRQALGFTLVAAVLITGGIFLLDGILILPAVLLFWMALSQVLPAMAYLVQRSNGMGGRLFLKKVRWHHPSPLAARLLALCHQPVRKRHIGASGNSRTSRDQRGTRNPSGRTDLALGQGYAGRT